MVNPFLVSDKNSRSSKIKNAVLKRIKTYSLSKSDLITENGFSVMTIYERNQSDNAHSDTLYLGLGYIPTDNIEYAMTLDNDKASLSYKRDLNGFDIRMSSNYSLMSQIPEYGATLEIVNTF